MVGAVSVPGQCYLNGGEYDGVRLRRQLSDMLRVDNGLKPIALPGSGVVPHS